MNFKIEVCFKFNHLTLFVARFKKLFQPLLYFYLAFEIIRVFCMFVKSRCHFKFQFRNTYRRIVFFKLNKRCAAVSGLFRAKKFLERIYNYIETTVIFCPIFLILLPLFTWAYRGKECEGVGCCKPSVILGFFVRIEVLAVLLSFTIFFGLNPTSILSRLLESLDDAFYLNPHC